MQLKILSKRIFLLIIVLSGLTFFLSLLFYSTPQSPVLGGPALIIGNVATIPNPEQATSGFPVRLRIPSINVDAPVEYVGLTPDGEMGVPKEHQNVAWFNLGSRPGESGSAIIAGHYGWKDGGKSVFDDLYKLRQGDKLYVEDDNGVTISFVVRESRRYDPNADASGVFGSNDGKPRLNLITCEGVWDKVSKTYSRRLVVFTDRE